MKFDMDAHDKRIRNEATVEMADRIVHLEACLDGAEATGDMMAEEIMRLKAERTLRVNELMGQREELREEVSRLKADVDRLEKALTQQIKQSLDAGNRLAAAADGAVEIGKEDFIALRAAIAKATP